MRQPLLFHAGTQLPRAQTSSYVPPSTGHLSTLQWADSRSSDSGTCVSPTDHSLTALLGTGREQRLEGNISEDVKTVPSSTLQLQPRNGGDASSRDLHFRKKEVYSRDDTTLRSELYLSQPGPSQSHYALPRPTFIGSASLSQSFPSPAETLHHTHRPRVRSRTVSQLVSTHGVEHKTRPTKKELESERFIYSQDFSSHVSAFKPVLYRGTQPKRGAEPSVWEGPATGRATQEALPEQSKMSECRYEALSGVELLDLLSRISDPNCTISKLE